MEELFRNYQFTIQAIIAIVAIFTVGIAYFINQKIGRNHLLERQVDHVISLLEKINESNIEILFATYTDGGSIGATGFSIACNIFEIGNYEDGTGNREYSIQYEQEQILFDSKTNQLIDIKKYIDHPLTPRLIANELLNFYNTTAINKSTN